MPNKSLTGSVFPNLEQEMRSQVHEKRIAGVKTEENKQKTEKKEVNEN